MNLIRDFNRKGSKTGQASNLSGLNFLPLPESLEFSGEDVKHLIQPGVSILLSIENQFLREYRTNDLMLEMDACLSVQVTDLGQDG